MAAAKDSAQCEDDLADLPPEARSIFGIFALQHQLMDRLQAAGIAPSLNPVERKMLVRLGRPMRMGQIAEHLGALPSSVTAAADALQAQGLLRRKPDPDDRRASLIELTATGAQERRKLIGVGVQIFREVSGLAPQEIERLAEILDQARAHRRLADHQQEDTP